MSRNRSIAVAGILSALALVAGMIWIYYNSTKVTPEEENMLNGIGVDFRIELSHWKAMLHGAPVTTEEVPHIDFSPKAKQQLIDIKQKDEPLIDLVEHLNVTYGGFDVLEHTRETLTVEYRYTSSFNTGEGNETTQSAELFVFTIERKSGLIIDILYKDQNYYSSQSEHR